MPSPCPGVAEPGQPDGPSIIIRDGVVEPCRRGRVDMDLLTALHTVCNDCWKGLEPSRAGLLDRFYELVRFSEKL